MEKFIPYEKLSKKKQKDLNSKKRNNWGSLNPITRKTKNLKVYNRKKTKNWNDDYSDTFSFFIAK